MNVDAIVRGYGLAEVTEVRTISARVRRLRCGEVLVAAKQYADVVQARREAGLLAHLAGRPDPRFAVQRLVRTPGGDDVLVVDGGAIVVTHWEIGTQRSFDRIDRATWEILGRELAALHVALDDAAVALPVLLDEVARLDLARERAVLDDHQRRVAEPELQRLLAERRYLLDTHGPRLAQRPPGDARAAACHHDYNQHNYLFVDAGPPVILDWDRAISAPREYEVVRCLNHLPLVATDHATAFVDGYRAVRALRADWLAWSIHAALAVHALKHWPIERHLAGEPDPLGILHGIVEVVHALVTRTDELAGFYARAAA